MGETNDQLQSLLEKAANGETLVALYGLIKVWVMEQIETSDKGVDEETVKEIFSEAFEDAGVLTEEEITTIVNNAISSANPLTEERVQEMIDESVGSAIAMAY